MHNRTLFVFRQDMRAYDNTWLWHAIQDSSQVLPCFIFDTTVFEEFPKNDPRWWFVVQAIEELEKHIQKIWWNILIRQWDPRTLLPDIIKEYDCDAIYRNKSYGTNTITRDSIIKKRCKENNIIQKEFSDYLLVEPEEIPARKVYGAFFKLRSRLLQWEQHQEALQKMYQRNTDASWLYTLQVIDKIHSPALQPKDNNRIENLTHIETKPHPYWSVTHAQSQLESYNFGEYDNTRNIPSLDQTSKLSPYIRFGILSIRDIYNTVVREHRINKNLIDTKTEITDEEKETALAGTKQYIKELAWREFAQHILIHFPHTRIKEFQEKRQAMQWKTNKEHFEARCKWKTWYPIVDAGMRQLVTENRMHNRVRMVVASFLTKHLHIDRREWDEFFRKYLLDYDQNVDINNR